MALRPIDRLLSVDLRKGTDVYNLSGLSEAEMGAATGDG
jgi:hypothetical protein